MKTHSNLILAACTLALMLVVLELAPSALGLPAAAAGHIPPGLTPVAYLPYLVLDLPAPLIPRSYLPYVAVAATPMPTHGHLA